MAFEEVFVSAFVYLLAAVVAVPVAKKLGMSSVLGYLVAGILIGPFVFGIVGQEGEDVMHFAEFGVVLMLFLIGLELEPTLLWKMRGPILGLGGLQVLVSTVVIAGIAVGLGLAWQPALAIGMALALSSTAIVLQTLQEKELTQTPGGRSAFSVLLFQDIAVIPMLAIFPLLATLETGGGDDQGHGHQSPVAEWVSHQPGWVNTLMVIGAVVVIILGGKFLARPVMRAIAATRVRETFTAFALLLVIGIALAMTWLGVSPALGTFLAGVVLANSEYRHELESDIEPFKGMLLGVFFISVGASIDFSLIFSKPLVVFGIVIGLMVVKGVILFVLGRMGRLEIGQRLFFSLALAQGGEFAFVLLGFAVAEGVVAGPISQIVIAAVALTMALTPLVLIVEERILRSKFERENQEEREPDEIEESAPVILAGFGRFGNFVGRLLRSQDVKVTVIDHDSEHIDFLRKIGIRAYFGDACRLDLLESAGAAEAKAIVIALENPDKSAELVQSIRKHFPNLKIFARAADTTNMYELINEETDFVVHQFSGSATSMGAEVLKCLGFRANRAERVATWFAQSDRETAVEAAPLHKDEDAYVSRIRERVASMQERFERDARMPMDTGESAWNSDAIRKGVVEGHDEVGD